MRIRRAHAAWLFLALVLLGLVALYITSDVSTALTKDDAAYAERILKEAGHGDVLAASRPADFDDQVETILAVQDAVLSTAPENEGIPLGEPRELRELYEAARGLCYDRSRAIEKILSHLGFEVRHAAVYATTDAGTVEALVTPRTPSHAVSEAKTDRGWLLIDSNKRWIGLTAEGEPVDLGALKGRRGEESWDPRLKDGMSRILAEPYTYLYGLYSRHGRFYPPYTPVPDVDWGQMPYNLTN